MSLYDLNFWEEPDWSRESSVNPVFIFVTTVSVLVVVALALVTAENRKLQAKVSELQTINVQNAPLKPKAAQSVKLKKQVDEWERAVKYYDELAYKNFAWSSQLEKIQRLIPDNILITSIKMSTRRADDTMCSQNKYPLPAWAATVSLQGVASGLEPYQSITTFFDNLGRDEQLSNIMVPKLGKTTAAGEDKEFKIDLLYTAR